MSSSKNKSIMSSRLSLKKILDEDSSQSNSNKQLIDQIKLKNSLLPSKVIGRLDEQRIKINGEVWDIYKYDADPRPSNPHAHNADSGVKMDLSNGRQYLNSIEIGKINQKQLKVFRSLVNPNIPLPPLEK